MNKVKIAKQLLVLARELVSMDFDTEEEKKKYEQEHDVRPGTKLTVKKTDKPSGSDKRPIHHHRRDRPPNAWELALSGGKPGKPNLPSPSSGSRKVKSIGGVSPQEYASQWGASGQGQARAHFYNYGSEKQTKDKAFYKEFIDGKGGIMDTMREVSDSLNRGEKKFDRSDLDDLSKLRGHVQAEMDEQDKPVAQKSSGLSHVLKDGTKIRIYDAGEEGGTDRYTAVLDSPEWDKSANPGMKTMLGFSESPEWGVSQFSEGREGKHLGKPIKFTSLPKDLQDHVIGRISEK